MFNVALVESLESRRLLSMTLSHAARWKPPVPPVPPAAPLTVTSTVLSGVTVNAVAGEPFRAVIGTLQGLPQLSGFYAPHADIDWGDGSAHSRGQLVHQADGSIAVLGDHTYATSGTDDITVVVTADPPPWSLAPVRLIGTFHSKANVIPSGGVTLEETAGVPFTERIAFFHTTVSPSTLTAVIEWGDGTQSAGKIEELPTAGPIPTFAVVGSHTYSITGSYIAHVTVYSSQPPPILAGSTPARPAPMDATTPPVYLVAKIDSVVEVLPPLASATGTAI